MKLRDLFRKKEPLTSAELQAAAATVESQITDARARLDAVLATFGDRAIAANSDGDLSKIEGELDAVRREIERLAYIKTSVATKLRSAQTAEHAESLAVQWAACEAACKARDEALSRVQSLAQRLGAAILDANQKGGDVWLAIPDEFRAKHWQTAAPTFTDVTPAAHIEMSHALHPERTPEHTPLHQQGLDATAQLLSLRDAPATT